MFITNIYQNLAMFKNIIFDWSGVIKDAVHAHLWVVNRMLKRFGGEEISFDEMKEKWEQPYMKFWSKFFPDLTLEGEQKAYYEVILDKDCPESGPYPGIIELIKKLKEKGILMAVLSSDPPETLFPDIKRFDLEDIFGEVVANIHDKAEVIHELIEKIILKKRKQFLSVTVITK